MPPDARRAFTVVELLVVVAIIAVLLSLLTPAIDAAMYRAELVVCGSRLKGIATAMMVYTGEHKRFLPYNKSLAGNATWHGPLIKLASASNDMRLILSPYMPLQDILFDPMIKSQDIETNAIDQMYGNYSLWNFWKWAPGVDPTSKAQRRLGDRFTYNDTIFGTGRYSWDILAGDFMRAVNTDTTPAAYWTNHPGKRDGSYLYRTPPGAANQYTFWISSTPKRDPVDYNLVRQDGAVETLIEVRWNDDRLANPTEFNTGLNASASLFHQMPLK